LEDAYLQLTIYRLREALAHYAHLDTYDHRLDHPDREELIEQLIKQFDHIAWEGEETSLVCYAFYYLGIIRNKNDDPEKALEAFKRAIDQPKAIQVPEIAPLIHLEYADALLRNGEITDAVKALTGFLANRQWCENEENVVRAKLYKAKAYFSWALDLRKKRQTQEAKQKYDLARTVCDNIDTMHPRYIGNVQQLINEWTTKIYPGVDFKDPAILRSKARRLYADSKYAAAAGIFQKAFLITKEPDERRISDAWYLVMCHYHLKQYYHAAAAAEFLVRRFDPDKFARSGKAYKAAIIGLEKQARETGDPFDEELYLRFRKALGEEMFKLFEAIKFKEQRKYQQALRTLADINPQSENYDNALLLIAECNELLSDNYLRQKDYPRCIAKQGEAIGLYQEFLAWSAKNPPQGNAAAGRRRHYEARALFKVGRLLTGARGKPTIMSYYSEALRHPPNAGRLPALLEKAAKALHQPPPPQGSVKRKQAIAMLGKMVNGANSRYLRLSSDIGEKYQAAAQVLPRLHYLRIIAAMKLGDLDTAEADLLAAEKFPEFGKQIPAATIYGQVAGLFDAKARKLEKEADAKGAQQAYAKAVQYYLNMIEVDPDQDITMLRYVILLVHTHGNKAQQKIALEIINDFLKKFGTTSDDPKSQDKIDHVRLTHARILLDTQKQTDAVAIYAELAERMETEYEKRKAADPKAARTPLHWEAKLGLARGKKALGKYEDAAAEFARIRKTVPKKGKTWWMATYEFCDCLRRLKWYDKCIKRIRTLRNLYPEFGGPATLAEFAELLKKISKEAEDDDIKTEALELINELNARNKEPR
ncbi:MAG: hypothetical protein HQ592_04175, partial [Planctomycetes bacterium]|nr:hypothetical protein [Planctomycetota bacterium]